MKPDDDLPSSGRRGGAVPPDLSSAQAALLQSPDLNAAQIAAALRAGFAGHRPGRAALKRQAAALDTLFRDLMAEGDSRLIPLALTLHHQFRQTYQGLKATAKNKTIRTE